MEKDLMERINALEEENKKIKNFLKDASYLLGTIAHYSDSGCLDKVNSLIQSGENVGLFPKSIKREKKKVPQERNKIDLFKCQIELDSFKGTWYVVSKCKHNGKDVYLLDREQSEYGERRLIVDEDLNILVGNAPKGFQNLSDLF